VLSMPAFFLSRFESNQTMTSSYVKSRLSMDVISLNIPTPRNERRSV
jgi:hypothetical protein